MEKKKMTAIVVLVCRAVALGMGVALIVLPVLGEKTADFTAMTGIAVFALALSLFITETRGGTDEK